MNTKKQQKLKPENQNFPQYISDDLDLSNTCRVCMAQCIDLYSLSTIPQCTGNVYGCIEKIHYCTNVKITENDGLPHTICEACVKLLDKAYEFKITCENSDEELRKIVSSINVSSEFTNGQDTDVTTQNSDIVSENDETEIANEFRNEYTDDIFLTPVLQPEILEIKERDKECAVDWTGCDTQAKLDEKNNSKYIDCFKKKKKHSKSCDEEFLEEDTSNDVIMSIVEENDNAVNEMYDPEMENETLETKRGIRKIRKLKCRGCTDTFADKRTRDEHQKTHGDRSFICDICGKGFFCHTTCYTHRKSHFPPKFSCVECPYKTCHRNDLLKHNRIHTGVKLYQCEYCCRSFTFNSNLVKHVKRHKGDRRFKCNLCPKAYFEKVSLSEHLDWHKGIKRHECRICGMGYVDRQHWVRHMEKMHEIHVPPTKSGRRKTNIQVTEPYHDSGELETHIIQATA